MLSAIAATGGGFLTAVLWFDLMFDVQIRQYRGQAIPNEILASIAGYYRRVTTQATPMNRVVSFVMVATLAALGGTAVCGTSPKWICWSSLVAALSAIGLAATRTVRNAKRLGAAQDLAETQARLARSIYRDHVICLAAMSIVVALQLMAIGIQ